MLATSKIRHTNVENPSADPDLTMSRYCGMYGTTPPKMIALEATKETAEVTHAGTMLRCCYTIRSVCSVLIFGIWPKK